MEYRFWKDDQGASPVLEEIHSIFSADPGSGKSYWLHLNRVEKYQFVQMSGKLLKKLKGANRYKIFELRFALPRKIARTFCIIDRNSVLWLLHLVIKKSNDTKKSDIEQAERRAAELESTIHYL